MRIVDEATAATGCGECGSTSGRQFGFTGGALEGYRFCTECIGEMILNNEYGITDAIEGGVRTCSNCGGGDASWCISCATPTCQSCSSEYNLNSLCSDCLWDWAAENYDDDGDHDHWCWECGSEASHILCQSCLDERIKAEKEQQAKDSHVVIDDGVISLDGVEINFTI